eukprot:scaffold46358_cov73-Phaeocystis_antarctica.AAC.2
MACPGLQKTGSTGKTATVSYKGPGPVPTACGGFSPTPWLAPRTGSRKAPGSSPDVQGAMRIPRLAAEKLGAVRPDPYLDGLLFGLISRALLWRPVTSTRHAPVTLRVTGSGRGLR